MTLTHSGLESGKTTIRRASFLGISLTARDTSAPVLGSSHAAFLVRPGELPATVSAEGARDAGLDGVCDGDRAGLAYQDAPALAASREGWSRGDGHQRPNESCGRPHPVSRPRRARAHGRLPSLRLDLPLSRRLPGLRG